MAPVVEPWLKIWDRVAGLVVRQTEGERDATCRSPTGTIYGRPGAGRLGGRGPPDCSAVAGDTEAEAMQRDHPDEVHGVDSDLLDVSDLDLSVLAGLPRNAFGDALRRVLRECEEQPMTYATYERCVN